MKDVLKLHLLLMLREISNVLLEENYDLVLKSLESIMDGVEALRDNKAREDCAEYLHTIK